MYKYGWRPNLPDHRDKYYVSTLTGKLPTSVDLRDKCPPVYDQSQLGSCTANAIAGHLDFNRQKQGEPFINPARLYIYYNELKDQNMVGTDAGASIRESVKAVVKYGAPPETLWPYDISQFSVEPPSSVYQEAVKYEALQYLRINQNELALKSCLAGGYPFVVGISVYQSFETPVDFKVPMPSLSEQLMGGHAIMIVGYDPSYWILRNSWGSSWADDGYVLVPKQYLLSPNLSRDFWTLRKVK